MIKSDNTTVKKKTYSIQSIQDRLKLSLRESRVQLRYIVLDYKRYYQSHKAELDKDPNKMNALKNLFTMDFVALFNSVAPMIEGGKMLNQLIGINQVTQGLDSVCRDFSREWKLSMTEKEKLGYISKSRMAKLEPLYNKVLDELRESVFSDK